MRTEKSKIIAYRGQKAPGRENNMIKYKSIVHGENDVEELTKERTRFLLKGCYKEEAVDDLIDNEKGFYLRTMTRDIWTETEDGLVPLPGFYGVVG